MNTKMVYSLGFPMFVMSFLCFLTVGIKVSQFFPFLWSCSLRIVTVMQSITVHAELYNKVRQMWRCFM